MWPSVRAAVRAFQGRFEGAALSWMYLDVKGLVTTGTGNLIDPVALAIGLPWERPDGTPATTQEIINCWHTVKAAQGWCKRGGGAYQHLPGNDLHLDAAALTDLFYRRLDANEGILRGRFPSYDAWPADAQLAVHSMAWALGASWLESEWPHFTLAVRTGDWMAAAAECTITGGGSIVQRNAADRALFESAARVVAEGFDPSVLVYSV